MEKKMNTDEKIRYWIKKSERIYWSVTISERCKLKIQPARLNPEIRKAIFRYLQKK